MTFSLMSRNFGNGSGKWAFSGQCQMVRAAAVRAENHLALCSKRFLQPSCKAQPGRLKPNESDCLAGLNQLDEIKSTGTLSVVWFISAKISNFNFLEPFHQKLFDGNLFPLLSDLLSFQESVGAHVSFTPADRTSVSRFIKVTWNFSTP